MKCLTVLIIGASLIYLSASKYQVDKTCICPQAVMDQIDVNSPYHDKSEDFGMLRCGKEINFITKNNLCTPETIFRCRGANKLAEILYKGDCGNWPQKLPNGTVIWQFCGRATDACVSDEDCWADKIHRVCFWVDAHVPKKFYQLDDKGKICCDQEMGGYRNPKLSMAPIKPPSSKRKKT